MFLLRDKKIVCQMHTITRICQQHLVFFVGHRGRHTGRYGQSPFGRIIARPCANQFKRLILSPSIHLEEHNRRAQPNPIATHAPKPAQSQRTRANNMQQTNKSKYTSGQGWPSTNTSSRRRRGAVGRCQPVVTLSATLGLNSQH